MLRGFVTADRTALGSVVDEAKGAVTSLRDTFFATPYRPTGLSTSTRVLIRLVDEVLLLATILDEGEGLACQILARRGIDPTELRTALREAHGSR